MTRLWLWRHVAVLCVLACIAVAAGDARARSPVPRTLVSFEMLGGVAGLNLRLVAWAAGFLLRSAAPHSLQLSDAKLRGSPRSSAPPTSQSSGRGTWRTPA